MFDHVRKLFAQTQEAKVRGYQPGRFSFNVKGGRCEACAGDGTIKIEMHFLPDVYVPCEVCKGARYNRDTLDITFKGKNIAEVLDMPCEEALEFFANQPAIARHLQTLVDVGLGYVRLGQPAPTLSGGEAQRVKLATELAKRSTGHTIYILDEPTTGLHFEDIRKLLTVLSRLVDQGNTVLVIEHNLDVIKTADWIIDLGPEGGDGGGMVVVEGPPELVAKTEASFTGQFLAILVSSWGARPEAVVGFKKRHSSTKPPLPKKAPPAKIMVFFPFADVVYPPSHVSRTDSSGSSVEKIHVLGVGFECCLLDRVEAREEHAAAVEVVPVHPHPLAWRTEHLAVERARRIDVPDGNDHSEELHALTSRVQEPLDRAIVPTNG